jgi:hypothetical protein
MRGNEEVFQGIRKILQFNNNLMQDLVNAGTEVLGGYFLVRRDFSALERIKDDLTFKKMNLVCALLEEIVLLLNSFMVSLSTIELGHLYNSIPQQNSKIYGRIIRRRD